MKDIFSGKWIAPAELCRGANGRQNVHAVFTASLWLDELPNRALLRVSADDYYKLRINDHRVCQGPAPAYVFRYSWNEIDISSYLASGENRFEFEVYYQGLVNRVWCSGDGRCGLIFDLNIGGKIVFQSDESVYCYISRRWSGDQVYGYDTQFTEHYDATVCDPEPCQAVVVEPADWVFDSEPADLLSVYEVPPERVEVLQSGYLFYDFGEELTGTIELSASGKAGKTIDIFYGEEKDSSPEGVRYLTRCGCIYHDRFTIGGENTFRGFDYKAFRYVSLRAPAGVDISDLRAIVRHAQFRQTGYLKLKNPIIRQVFEICKRGVMLGAQEVFVDCPSREKGQYAGDLLVTSASYYWLTGDFRMLRRALRSFIDSSCSDSVMLAVAPCSHRQNIVDYTLIFPLLAKQYYRFSGDQDFLKECFDFCKKILAEFERSTDRGLIVNANGWDLVDWPETERDGYEFPDDGMPHNVINAWYIGAVKAYEEIGNILRKPVEPRFEQLRDEFNRRFWRGSVRHYSDHEKTSHCALHSNILPLYFGLCPDDAIRDVAEYILKKGLACSVYFSYFLLMSLLKAGRREEVIKLIASTGERSWYNMIKEGATTCFEAWGKNYKWNTSLCHPWGSAPIAVLGEMGEIR